VKVGDHVAWRWANGVAEGVIREIRTESTVIESKGKRIVRNGTPDNPAIIIAHTSGTPVLKLMSEIQQTT
jgi:hypothetical protein